MSPRAARRPRRAHGGRRAYRPRLARRRGREVPRRSARGRPRAPRHRRSRPRRAGPRCARARRGTARRSRSPAPARRRRSRRRSPRPSQAPAPPSDEIPRERPGALERVDDRLRARVRVAVHVASDPGPEPERWRRTRDRVPQLADEPRQRLPQALLDEPEAMPDLVDDAGPADRTSSVCHRIVTSSAIWSRTRRCVECGSSGSSSRRSAAASRWWAWRIVRRVASVGWAVSTGRTSMRAAAASSSSSPTPASRRRPTASASDSRGTRPSCSYCRRRRSRWCCSAMFASWKKSENARSTADCCSRSSVRIVWSSSARSPASRAWRARPRIRSSSASSCSPPCSTRTSPSTSPSSRTLARNCESETLTATTRTKRCCGCRPGPPSARSRGSPRRA